MQQADAVRIVQEYAAQWGLSVISITLAKEHRHWRVLRPYAWDFRVETSDGKAAVHVNGEHVAYFFYTPSNPKAPMLPLWAVYPAYSSVTMGWRMLSAQDYKYEWHRWYRGLGEEERSAYKKRFPPPTDEARAWGANWYEEIADVPAGSKHAIADFIVGRV